MTTELTHGLTTDGRCFKRVAMDFNPDFPARARAEGGKFAETTRAWFFDARDNESGRALGKRIRALLAAFGPFNEI